MDLSPTMQNLIDLLKSIQLFANTPDTILVEVSRLLKEVSLPEGATIFAEGELGDAMYIVALGRIHIHRGGRTLTYLENGAVFGEMALLDPEPRSATATVVSDALLLRLERTPFYQIMGTRPEVASGVIQLLCRQLRERLHEMVDDHHYIQQVARLTNAAGSVESGVYEPDQIDGVAARKDELGRLARVFQDMIRKVAAREQRLQQQVQELRIEVDKARRDQQVEQITSTDYFQELRSKADDLRTRMAAKNKKAFSESAVS
ncbi:cyclic nucleotide-binding domain-containing protein [Chloroflexi bacterium TSY]|nr:cyclic nucleotide-binding domain-containing protein [Chloroflexi bacterium TSY]